MPVYQYQGQHFDLPDGLSNEEAIGKIKKHLGQAPKEEGPSFIDKAQTLAANVMNTPALKNYQIPASFATGMLGQVAGGLRGAANLMSGGDVNSANKVMEDTQQALTYQPRDESQKVGNELLGKAMQMPADIAGDALGSMGADVGYENLGRTLGEAGMNIGLNVAPLVHGLIRPRPKEAPRPVPNVEDLRPVTPEAGANFAKDPEAWRQQQLAERTRLDAQDQASTDNTLHQQPLFDQPSEGRPPSPYEAVTGDWRIDENGMPIKADLSMDVQNASEPLQRNMWGDELPRKHEQESIPLTEAMDSMGRVELSDAIARELTGAVEPSGELQSAIVRATPDRVSSRFGGRGRATPNRVSSRFGGRQRGHAGFLKDALDMFDEWYTGSPSKLERTRSLLEQIPLTNSEQQKAGPGALEPIRGPKNQRGSAPIINDMAKALIRRMKGQTESGTVKNSPVGEVPVAKDSMATPTVPATIDKKQDIREKLDASSVLKKIAPEYSSITTPQEAIQLAKDSKDIGYVPGVDNFRNATISGMNGMVMLKRNNPIFNFLRFKNQEWRNIATKFSKDYVTAKDGFATLGRELSKPELVQAMETLKKAADARIAITADNIGKLGLSTKQESFILSVRKAMDAMDAMRGDAMLSTGRDPAKSLPGYLPSVWTGAYKGMIRVGDRVIAVPQSDTYLGYKNAVKAILKDNPSATVVNFPRKGLNAMYQGNNMFNGFNDVLNVLAKNDPGLAHLQQVAAMKINDATHQVMGFHIHEMAKQGVKGALGDRAHVSASRNAHDLFKALVDYAEQGAEYYSMQKGLNEIGQVLTDPALEHLPNTKAVAEQYVKHVSGQDLNPIGAALNWTVDALPRALGMSSKVPLQGLRGLKTAMGIHMMGLWNPTFIGLQATQVFTGAMPEIIKVGSKLHQDVTASTAIGPTAMLAMRAAEAAGKEMPSFVPEHLQAAYKYAQDHGIMQLSELENAKNASRNKAVSTAEEIGALPIKLGEVFTRSPVFMIFADIFHKFGLKNEEAFMAAHHATNISMGDYHPSERPQIYSQLGIIGEFGGALTTYKHNALTNMYLHGRGAVAKDVAGNRQYAAAASAVAAGAMFYGITGMPGFDELDSAYQWATGQLGNSQGIRETALETMPEWSKSGFLSASTGLDFQSRTSMSKVLPEMKMSSLSPQLGALADIGVKAYAYGQYGDQQSFNDLMKSITPNGLKGYTEDKLMTDPDGTVRNAAGEQMAPEPRTDKERLIRKVFAVRPLRESIESKDVYIDAKNVQAKEKAQNQIAQRFRQAFASGDTKGMITLAQMYYDKEGDPQTLLNDQAIQNQIYKSNISQRDRMTGMLTATMKSVNRYRDMNDGK